MNDCYQSHNDYNHFICNSFVYEEQTKRGVQMPQTSRYSNQEFEALMNKIIVVLEENDADRDLSLMILGNLVTNILNNQVPSSQRKAMAEQFSNVLMKSVQG